MSSGRAAPRRARGRATPTAGMANAPRGLVPCAVAALLLTGGVEREAATLNREATDAFEAKQFEEATQLYTEALTHSPESSGISYNLGNALHRNQRLEDAASALSRAALTDDLSLRHSALHNLGNTLLRMGMLPQAVDAYRRALDANPADLDTKINFEKALQMLQQQEQEQQQQQQQQQDQEENQEGEEGESGEQNPQPEESDQEQEQRQPQEEQRDSEEESSSSEQEPEQPQEEQLPEEEQAGEQVAEGELSYEEAVRILEAMRDQEKEQQKARAEKLRARSKRTGKDW